MRKMLAAIAFGAAFVAGTAFADTMQNAYGNTVTVTYPNGGVSRYHFNADHSFTLRTPDNRTVTGTWAQTGDQLCLTPQGAAQAQCSPYVPGKKVGDTWTQQSSNNQSISVTLTAGR